jgi:hypothetical protein
MPYTRRYRRRSAAQKNKRFIKRRTGARAQSSQLLSLQKQVTRLSNANKMTKQRAQYAVPLDANGGTDAELSDGLFNVFSMTDFTGSDTGTSAWAPLFQARPAIGTGNEQAPNKCKILKYDCQLLFSPKNSLTAQTPRIVRVFWVTLRKETAAQTLEDTANMTTAGLRAIAGNGQYVYKTESNGGLETMIKLNPAAFNIRRYREFKIANIINETPAPDPDDDQDVSVLSDAMKTMRFRVSANNVIKAAHGGWLSMNGHEVENTDRHYLITHVGGWGDDSDNGIHLCSNVVATVEQTN